MTDEFMALTGLDAEQAQFYMEMVGFDTEMALQLYFASSEETSVNIVSLPAESVVETDTWTNDDLKDIVFPRGGAVHEAWLVQGLAPRGRFDGFVSSNGWDQLGIDQPQNGPCGVVAVYMGGIITALYEVGKLRPGVLADDTDLTRALGNILMKSKRDTDYQICTWASGSVGGPVVTATVSTEEGLLTVLSSCLDQYLSPGGAILLCYSAVATYGAHKFQGLKDIVPLVSNYETQPFQLCTSALMNLLLSGEPNESLDAYDRLTGEKKEWTARSPLMGLLSGSESELKMRVHDAYKFPKYEIYVLHGRDHFTLCFEVPGSRHTVSIADQEEAIEFSIVHWNGLPPAGPMCTTVNIIAREASVWAPATAALGVGKDYKPLVGSIDSIVQADPSDKRTRPGDWKKWRYEVALAVDDPTDVTEERPAHLPMPAIFSLNDADMSDGQPWRCRSCYQVRYINIKI